MAARHDDDDDDDDDDFTVCKKKKNLNQIRLKMLSTKCVKKSYI